MTRNATMLLGISLLLAGLGLPKASGDPQDDAFRKELKAMAGTLSAEELAVGIGPR